MLFKSRIQLVLVVFVCAWVMVVGRLFHLQVVSAGYYRELADAKLVLKERSLETRRGRILDRHGTQLAADEPAWNIALHFKLLDRQAPADSKFLARLAQPHIDGFLEEFGHTDDPMKFAYEAARARVRDELRHLWVDISQYAEGGLQELDEIAWHHMDTIASWKDDYYKKHHIDTELAEERQCHALVAGLTGNERIDVQQWLTQRYGRLVSAGAVRLTDSSRRNYVKDPSMGQILGTLREASRTDIQERPYHLGDDRFDHGGYCLGDRRGATGIEASFEDVLRGARGRLIRYRDERNEERTPPRTGQDVTLSIDLALQNRVYDILQTAVHAPEPPNTPGGAVVVLDVASREVLALVSYPSYDTNMLRSNYAELVSDTIGRPLVHRAVYSEYPPGSIVKPITVTAGLDAGVITPTTTLECQGRLLQTSRLFKCWRPQGKSEPMRHGTITGQEALMGSCNVFCFKTADLMSEKLGREQALNHMCFWMQQFGIGDPSGAQLDERTGNLPTPEWLREHRVNGREVRLSDPRNYAIGQGEVEVTPLQAANMVATYASGIHRPVTLIKGQSHDAQQRVLPDSTWQVVRRGMYDVVNSTRGTAKKSQLSSPGFCLCGKSGSAQAGPLIVSTIVGCNTNHPTHVAEYETSSVKDARDKFLEDYPEHTAEEVVKLDRTYWPEKPAEGRSLSHAWFVGFIQPTRDGTPDWRQQAPLAIAVLLEFGDSGGRVAGPVCKTVADTIIMEFPEYLATGTTTP